MIFIFIVIYPSLNLKTEKLSKKHLKSDPIVYFKMILESYHLVLNDINIYFLYEQSYLAGQRGTMT